MWVSVHAWRASAQARGIAALKQAKAQLDPGLIRDAAEPVASLIRQSYGPYPADAITAVPCGHSRRSDCFSKRLAQAIAVAIGVPWIQVFADRPVAGSSHPRSSVELPPLQQIGAVPHSVIIVDDVATPGRHLEEAVLALRRANARVSAFAWISGSASSGQPFTGFDQSPQISALVPPAPNQNPLPSVNIFSSSL